VTALYEKRFINIVWDSWLELDRDFKAFISKDFAGHVTALDDALTWESAQVNVELERYFPDVFDKEVSWLTLVVGNFTKVKIVCA